ncbi:MAG: hypothetical protein M0C28_07165 [Candidatus Moduliflexus flocculans]|nr:hypothetical protein [Candidatus Moduliflexus flocculans]
MSAAWQAAIYPDHGWGGKEGQVTDRLFRKKYEFARDEGRAVLLDSLTAISGRIAVDPTKGVPIVVFNTLSWARDGARDRSPVFARIRISRRRRGGGIPAAHSDRTGWHLCRRRSSARVHSLRCPRSRLQDLLPQTNGAPTPAPFSGPSRARRRGRSRTTSTASRLAPGGVASLYDKELGREVLDTRKFLGFEVFTMRSVGNGAGEFGRVQQPTMEGFDSLGRHKPVWHLASDESGPIKTVLALEQPLPDCLVRQKLIVYNWIKRIDCEVELRWLRRQSLPGVPPGRAGGRGQGRSGLRDPLRRPRGRQGRSGGHGRPRLWQPRLRRGDEEHPAPRSPKFPLRGGRRFRPDPDDERRRQRLQGPDGRPRRLPGAPAHPARIATELPRRGELVPPGGRPPLPVLRDQPRRRLEERLPGGHRGQ